MAVDHIRYDILTQDALRGVVRTVLADAAKNGLPGEHHFLITFDPRAEGVQLSKRMREQYPDEMTIVLQHQFWDMVVTDNQVEVGLSFGGVAERVIVPFAAVIRFVDPSVQFAVQFEQLLVAQEESAGEADAAGSQARPPAEHKPARGSELAALPPSAPSPTATDDNPSDSEGAQVVRLDRFRKK